MTRAMYVNTAAADAPAGQASRATARGATP